MFSDEFLVDLTGRNQLHNAPASPQPEPAEHRASFEQNVGSSRSSATRGWQGALRAAMDAAATVGEAVSRTAASAAEVLADRDLRRKGAAIVMAQASTRLKGIQQGFATGASTLSKGLGMVNRRQLQAVLSRIERQIADYQRGKQLVQYRKQPVDVQIGSTVYEAMPQELRMRLWWVLLENPSLVEPLRPIQCRSQMSSPSKLSLQGQTGSEVIAAVDAAALGLTPWPPEHPAGTTESIAATPSSDDILAAPINRVAPEQYTVAASSIQAPGVTGTCTAEADEVAVGVGSNDTPATTTTTCSTATSSARTLAYTPTATATAGSYTPPPPVFADPLLDLSPAAAHSLNDPSTPANGGTLQFNDTFVTLRDHALGSPSLSIGSTTSGHRSMQPAQHPSILAHTTAMEAAAASAPVSGFVSGSSDVAGEASSSTSPVPIAPAPSAATRPLTALLQRLTTRTQPAIAAGPPVDASSGSSGSSPQSPPTGSDAPPATAHNTLSFLQRAFSTRSSEAGASDEGSNRGGCAAGYGASSASAMSTSLPVRASASASSRLLSLAMQPMATGTLSTRRQSDSFGGSGGDVGDTSLVSSFPGPPAAAVRSAVAHSSQPLQSASAGSSMEDASQEGAGQGHLSLGGNSLSAAAPLGDSTEDTGGSSGVRVAPRSSTAGRQGQVGSHGTPATDEWELVAGDGPDSGDASEAVLMIMRGLAAQGGPLSDSSTSEPETQARQALFEAMLQVPWDSETGMVPAAFPDDCRFAMLNEMTAGQEEIDEIINRDINRTFPEHPFFGLEHGQQALFRVLKAYSLHDLETGYCQGMAFAAGVLLMYMPEEPAFRLYCRLMDPEGPNLRRMYLPGLDALKAELAVFEHLVAQRLPHLFEHLQAFGVPPVLYTSQWLMTVFATPFPPSFCARVIDIMLQDNDDHLLQRISLAIMEELQAGLLQLHDFEALITHLKVEPLQWGPAMIRAIFDAAIHSPISNTLLAEAHTAAAAEMAKLGRNNSSGWGATTAGGDGGGRHRTRRSSRHDLREGHMGGSDAVVADGHALGGGLCMAAGVSTAAGAPLNKSATEGVSIATGHPALAVDDMTLGTKVNELDGLGEVDLDLDLEYMNLVLELGLQSLEGQDNESLAEAAVVNGVFDG